MSKKELILVHPTKVIDDLFQLHGFVTGSDIVGTFDDMSVLEAGLDEGLAIVRREAAEENPNYRHLLPYVQLFRVGVEGDLEIFVYQRVKGSGEERLLGRHSIGLGGHINVSHAQFYDAHSSLNLGMTIMYNVMEELCEELTINDKPFIEGLLEQNIRSQPSIYGYLNDHSDAVGERHLGVTMLMMIPGTYEPMMGETSAVKVGFVKVKDLQTNLEAYNFENWSRLILEGLTEDFIADLTQAGTTADAQFAEYQAQQEEALKGLVAVGGVEGLQGEGVVKEGFKLDDVDNRVTAEVAPVPSEETCSAECQAEHL